MKVKNRVLVFGLASIAALRALNAFAAMAGGVGDGAGGGPTFDLSSPNDSIAIESGTWSFPCVEDGEIPTSANTPDIHTGYTVTVEGGRNGFLAQSLSGIIKSSSNFQTKHCTYVTSYISDSGLILYNEFSPSQGGPRSILQFYVTRDQFLGVRTQSGMNLSVGGVFSALFISYLEAQISTAIPNGKGCVLQTIQGTSCSIDDGTCNFFWSASGKKDAFATNIRCPVSVAPPTGPANIPGQVSIPASVPVAVPPPTRRANIP
jgi:hypothetical protein